MVTEKKPLSDRAVSERSLCSTGTFSLDLEPVIHAIDSLGVRIREEGNAGQKKTAELAMLTSSLSSDVAKNTKLLLGLQGCLQALEEQQRKLSDQNIRNRFTKPLARKLLGLRASAAEIMEDEGDFNYIANTINDILGDFGIEIMEPESEERLDLDTMKPGSGGPERKTSEWVVQELSQPGARCGDYILECARVKLIDRADYVNPSSRQEAHIFTVPRD